MRCMWTVGILLVLVSLACGQPSRPPLGPVATAPAPHNAPTAPLAPPTSTPVRPTPTPAPPTPIPVGPYATLDPAEAYVTSQTPYGPLLQLISPDATWRPSAVLHVIHATPGTGANYLGDYYYFFVNGYPVGMQFFTDSTRSAGVDDTTYSITYWVFRRGDPMCCPSGGQTTVRFQWNGARLKVLDPMPGPAQS